MLEWQFSVRIDRVCFKVGLHRELLSSKEMILGSLQKHPTLSLVISDQAVEQVSIFKLLGVFVNDCLRWNDHVDSITAIAMVFEETQTSRSSTKRPCVLL